MARNRDENGLRGLSPSVDLTSSSEYARRLWNGRSEVPKNIALHSGRWGNQIHLVAGGNAAKPSATFVVTPVTHTPVPLAFQVRFSRDGSTYSPYVPADFSGNVNIVLTTSVDQKAGSVTETLVLTPGQAQPFCTTIARSLTLGVVLDSESEQLYVSAVACPTEKVDCETIAPAAQPSTWNNAEAISFPASTVGPFLALPAAQRTRQIIIQNNTDIDLYIGFGDFIPGAPPFSNMLLPGGINAVWSSDPNTFNGAVRGAFASVGDPTQWASFVRGINS